MESIETSDKKTNAKGAWPHLTQIVYVPIMNAWYDPSYGIKYTSMQAIDNIFDGFLVQSGGGVHAFFLQKNPAGIQIKFQ